VSAGLVVLGVELGLQLAMMQSKTVAAIAQDADRGARPNRIWGPFQANSGFQHATPVVRDEHSGRPGAKIRRDAAPSRPGRPLADRDGRSGEASFQLTALRRRAELRR